MSTVGIFGATGYQIISAGARPRPRWGNLQHSPNRGGKGREKGRSREKEERRERRGKG